MAMKINPPDFAKCKTYEQYKVELEAWQAITDLPKEKQAIAVALSLPQTPDTTGIRERVFEELELSDLKKEDGMKTLTDYLDKNLGKDDLVDSLEKFEDFEDYTRRSGQSINDYVAEFDQKYNKLRKLKMELPSAILAFKLLKRANITQEERLLVLTGMNYTEKEKLYDQAKTSLKKFKGEQVAGGCSGGSVSVEASAIKLEPVYSTTQEEGLVAGCYGQENRFRGRGWRGAGRGAGGRGFWGSWRGVSGSDSAGNWRQHRGNGGSGGRGSRDGDAFSSRGRVASTGGRGRGLERPVNPTGSDGNLLLCLACGSFRHLVADCPYSWENRGAAQVHAVRHRDAVGISRETEEAALLTGFHKDSLSEMSMEARNCAVLDSACTSTVCGKEWLNCYLDSLTESDQASVEKEAGTKWFKFGGGEKVHSQGCYTIPAVLAGKDVRIRTDVVDSDIPLLLSKSAMKKAKVKMDLENDTAEIYGTLVSLNHTTSGHYSVPIDRMHEVPVESVCAVKLDELDDKDRLKVLLKLHRQFTHPPEKKLIALLKDARVWHDDYRVQLSEIYDKCELCKVYKKTPSRPAVALPMATRFNQKVCMDLKKWGDKWILHLIDMFSRLSISTFISRKRPSDDIDKIMTCWVGAGFGVMEAILTDNGGEFNADEIREVASILNVEVLTTAAYSPFQNGLCERNHAVVDMMLMKLREQCPQTEIGVLLAWANVAKNSLQMWHGFSSYQIVFGKNPNLPNILTDEVPALEGSTTSETLARHLDSLHKARRAFIQSEADERIRRALRSKVRASEQVFEPGDHVFYKRDGHDRWLGPGKVIFQDGKVVFVRHGGIFVRVSPNRLLKAGCEYATSESVSTPQCRGDEFLTDDLFVEGSSSQIVPSKSVLQETLQYSPISDGDRVSEEQEGGAERFSRARSRQGSSGAGARWGYTRASWGSSGRRYSRWVR